MGLLSGIRRITRKSAHAMTASFGELDAVFLPERHHQLDGVKSLKSMSVMRDDGDSGAPPYPVDLASGTAVIRLRRSASR
jgi:hypothetical protein